MALHALAVVFPIAQGVTASDQDDLCVVIVTVIGVRPHWRMQITAKTRSRSTLVQRT
jgi:hypothetical protein